MRLQGGIPGAGLYDLFPSGALLAVNLRDDAEPYPPVPILPVMGDAVWPMDLLARYGGRFAGWSSRQFIVECKEKAALFLVQPI